MTEADMVALAEQVGLEHGLHSKPYRPPLRWQICEDADDAYRTAYWFAFSHIYVSSAHYKECNS